MSFDLTYRPWIPVLMKDGTTDELSLSEVFTHAAQVRCLAAGLATTDAALLRLLLAVVHDAIDGPTDDAAWAHLWQHGLDDGTVTSYLAEHAHRFDLLHPTTPFLQTADLTTKQGPVGVDRIIPDSPNNHFFTLRARGADRLSFAEAARYLVTAHAYDPSGIKAAAVGDGRAKGGKVYPLGTGPAGRLGTVVVHGTSLAHTLILNLAPGVWEGDAPTWRRPPLPATEQAGAENFAAGPRSLYTWPSRRVRMDADAEGVRGVILTYGDPLQVMDRQAQEPMSAWGRSAYMERTLKRDQVWMPRRTDYYNVPMWRHMLPLLGHSLDGRGEVAPSLVAQNLSRQVEAGVLDPGTVVSPEVVKVAYGTQDSVIADADADQVRVEVGGFAPPWSNTLVRGVQDTYPVVAALGSLARNLAQAAGMDADAARTRADLEGWALVDTHGPAWVESWSHQQDQGEQLGRWRRTLIDLAREQGRFYLESAGRAAREGRLVEVKSGASVWACTDRAETFFDGRLGKIMAQWRGESEVSPSGPGELLAE